MNVLHLLHTVGEAYSEETAVASVDGELTYEELYERVDRYAAALRTHLEPGDRFSLFMGNSNRMLSVLLAGWQMGALPAPINTRLGVDEIAGLIEDAGARFVVVDEAYADRVDESVTPEGVPVYRSSGDGDGGHAGRFEAALPEGDVERCVRSKLDTEEAMFLHSAGTTGRPKWVRITHGNLAGSLGPMVAANLDADDVGLHYYPLYHSGGIDMTLCRLLCGATTVIGRGWDAEDALERIERHGANGITVVPQMGYELAHHDAVELPDGAESFASYEGSGSYETDANGSVVLPNPDADVSAQVEVEAEDVEAEGVVMLSAFQGVESETTITLEAAATGDVAADSESDANASDDADKRQSEGDSEAGSNASDEADAHAEADANGDGHVSLGERLSSFISGFASIELGGIGDAVSDFAIGNNPADADDDAKAGADVNAGANASADVEAGNGSVSAEAGNGSVEAGLSADGSSSADADVSGEADASADASGDADSSTDADDSATAEGSADAEADASGSTDGAEASGSAEGNGSFSLLG